jgi:methyltransferase
MPPSTLIAVLTLAAVLLVMAGESLLSSHNARVLRQRGAVEPPTDVYRVMQWAYPLCFVLMAIEGALTGPAPRDVLVMGLGVFGGAKALKIWAMTTLGVRWTYRVLVLPGVPLVTRGPYALVRHPNYVAVLGELAGVAMIVWAPAGGVVSIVGFGTLLMRRIAVEDRALGRR